MPDESHLDRLYFVDSHVYNCPFCNRRHVKYSIVDSWEFDWTNDEKCFGYIVRCHSCGKQSMHLTRQEGVHKAPDYGGPYFHPGEGSIDDAFFFSVPTSFFTLDRRIPRVLRDLIIEAEGCLKSNYLTGASACVRKVVYELAGHEGAQGNHYEERIKSLKKVHTSIEPIYFDTLLTIQRVTSSKVHEAAYDGWKSQHLRVLLASLRKILYELYVVPARREAGRQEIQQLSVELLGDNNNREEENERDG